jgi:hypothetical protein
VLVVLLAPGKRWIKSLPPNGTQDLRLVKITNGKSQSQSQSEVTGYRTTVAGREDVVATIIAEEMGNSMDPQHRRCPRSLQLPGASEQLQRRVDAVLLHCHDPLFVHSADLRWRQHHSMSLLTMQPAMMFVNGSDQSMLHAARSVDRFLAAHSVLDIAWEPMDEHEPQVWVLIPRPLGMPGHMFAALDAMQWRHPLVSNDMSFKQPKCVGKQCVQGCEHTKLAGISASGYSADAFNIFNKLREGFMRNLPVQAFPTTLGARTVPPRKCA